MKLSTALTFALASSTSAFTSMSRKSSNTALQMSELNIPGALPPVGLFDPLGFAAKANDATLLRYREAEVTHGRVAMLAAVGFLVGEKVDRTNTPTIWIGPIVKAVGKYESLSWARPRHVHGVGAHRPVPWERRGLLIRRMGLRHHPV